MKDKSDPDLPGDKSFRPINGGIVDTPRGPAWVVAISPDEQADQHHNLLRYAELQKLRRGQPNRYLETRYRT